MNLQRLLFRLPVAMRRHTFVRMLLAVAPGVRRQLIRFNEHGQLFGDVSDSAVRNYFLKAEFEPEFFKIAAPFLEPGGVFFDVGANFGFCTFGLLGMQSGSGLHCHLFEANEMICNYLGESRQLHRDSRIEIVRAVVTDQPGETRFSINSEALGESTVSEKGGTAVPNVVLDEYIRQHGIETVDFAKMDIEGWEPAALRGARESLRSGILKAIYFEVSPALLSSHGFCPLDALAILRECGYEIFFCKAADRENGVIPAQDWTERRVRNRSMLVAPVLNFPEAISTDLLAVHRSLLP